MNVGSEVSKRFVVNVLGTVSGFLGTVLFTRFVGIGGIGSYAVFQSFQMVVGAVVSVGAFQTVVKYVSASDDEARHFASGALLVAAGTAFSAVAFFLAAPWVNDAIGADAAMLVPLGVGSWMSFRLVGSFLEGKGRVALAGLIENLRYVVIVVAQLAFYAAGFEVGALFWGLIVGQTATAAFAYLAVARVRPARPSPALFRDFLGFSKYAYVKTLSAQLFKHADYIILGQFGTPAAAGVYKVSFTTAETSMLFSSALSRVSFPEFSRRSAEETANTARELLGQVFSYAGLFAVPVIAGGAVVGNGLLLTVFAVSPRSLTLPVLGTVGLGNVLIAVLGAANLLNGYRGPLENYYYGVDQPRMASASGVLLITVYAATVIPLLNAFGAVGLALATALAFGASVVVLLWFLDHPVPRDALRDLLAQGVAALLMAAVVAGVAGVLGGTGGVLRLGALLATGGVAYFAFFLALSARARRDAYWISRDILGELR